MSTIRVARRSRFTTIDRETVNDDRLSFKAKGLLLWLLDKPDDWHLRSEDIALVGPDGRDSVRSGLQELEAAGYIKREKLRRPDGTFNSTCIVYERPAQTGDGKPDAGGPAVGEAGPLMKTENEDCVRGESSTLAPRPRNLLFDALVDACGLDASEMTPAAQRACGVAASELKRAGADPGQVAIRAQAYRMKFSGAAITPTALAKHWANCRPDLVLQEQAGPKKTNVADRYAIRRNS